MTGSSSRNQMDLASSLPDLRGGGSPGSPSGASDSDALRGETLSGLLSTGSCYYDHVLASGSRCIDRRSHDVNQGG